MRLNIGLAEKILGGVNEDDRFFCENGEIFSNLKELGDGIKNMNDEVFLHHTGNNRNDFANWIHDCFGDSRLANSLIGLDKKSTAKKLKSRINYVKKYLEKSQ